MEWLKLIVPGLVSIIVAILGAQWFSPEALRLDIWLPTKDVQVLDDFVFVHFEFYDERDSESPREAYQDALSSKPTDVFDKVSYVEHVSIRKSKAKYKIRLASTEILPEIIAISPPLRDMHQEIGSNNARILTAELDLDQSINNYGDRFTPNPKMIYVFRNGFQNGNSSGGKNIVYDTDRLTFVYDFSTLGDMDKVIRTKPQVCIKRQDEELPNVLPIKWQGGVAVAEAQNLKKGDKVRIFWTWARVKPGLPEYPGVTCEKAL